MFKRALSLLAAGTLFSGSFLTNQAQADAMVWRVSNEHGELYLGGTIHMLRPSDYPLKPEYDIAFKDSDTLVFETDINAAMDMGFQQQMMMQMSLPPGKTLQDILSPKTYTRLSTFAAERGLPIDMLQSFKPALVAVTLTQLELQKLGITATNGIESYFSGLAKTHNKSVSSLETPDEQIAIMASMGEGYEDDFINGSLDDFENLAQEFKHLINAWKEGDVSTINEKMTTMMKDRFPQMYNNLLVKRNFNWIKEIDRLIKTPDKEFILVGAAHLAGNDSVQNLLKAQGYTIEKVTPTSKSKSPNI
ncbi:TraB/GumN family protein [Marinagarivorans algicola]|uniref:TraB/GumN family protein n=1 Tax=Marinagarivorans algicola TaxID=1513270 RepID=UPI0006B670F3|nr:TraB/GumN family protein [Marinagarivorans algicola]